MKTDLLLQVLGSVAFVTLVTSVTNNLMTRKRLGAEATKIITDAATGVVTDVRADNKRLRDSEVELRGRIDALEKAQDAWEDEKRRWKQILQDHEHWDTLVSQELRSVHPETNIPDPPPLTP